MKYLVQKKGFKDSAAIFDTEAEARRDAKVFYPDCPFRIIKITEEQANRRRERFIKQFEKTHGHKPLMGNRNIVR